MRASFYVAVCSGCMAWVALMLTGLNADKKRPTEVGRRDIGSRVSPPVFARGSGR